MNTQYTRFIDESRPVSVVPSTLTWEQLEGGELNVGFQVLIAGPLVISLRSINLAFHAHALVSSERSGVMAVESDTDVRWRGSAFGGSSLALGNEIDVRTTGASTLLAVAVDQPKLQAAYSDSLDASNLVERLARNVVTTKPEAANQFRAAIRSACARPDLLPSTAAGTLTPMLATMLEETDHHSVERSHCPNRRYIAVRACASYMREHVEDTITLLDLTRASGMRSRSLINAFRAIMGLSPMDYLKRLRLTSARSALLRADPHSTRVIDVATDWGFWHMGHFAHDYRAMFGEVPSQTLANARRYIARD